MFGLKKTRIAVWLIACIYFFVSPFLIANFKLATPVLVAWFSGWVLSMIGLTVISFQVLKARSTGDPTAEHHPGASQPEIDISSTSMDEDINNANIEALEQDDSWISRMRTIDILSILVASSVLGGFLALGIAFYLDEVVFLESSFYFVWIASSLFLSPLAFFWVRSSTLCPRCRRPFALSDTHQEDLEHYTKHKSEVRYNSNGNSEVFVPYNCRRYRQWQECDYCGYECYAELTEEKRA